MTNAETTQKTKRAPTPRDASRVQAANTKDRSGVIAPGSYVGRIQRAASTNFGKSGEKLNLAKPASLKAKNSDTRLSADKKA